MDLHLAPSTQDLPRTGLRRYAPVARGQTRFAAVQVTRFLRSVARGITADCSFDPIFTDTLSLPGLRGAVMSRFGVDTGFDAAAELFSSMISVRLLARVVDDDGVRLRDAAAARFAARHWQRRYRMFAAQGGFAADTDCSGVALAGLFEAGKLDREALLQGGAELLRSAARPGDGLVPGVVMVYWEDGEEPHAASRGMKQDPAAACNALHALKLAARAGLIDRDGVIEATTRYIAAHLVSGAYATGTRYYPSPDAFLYFAAELCDRFADCRARLASALAAALRHRDGLQDCPGHPGDPGAAINVALRLIAARRLGLVHERRSQVARLLRVQTVNGAWRAGTFFSLGKLPVYFGSPELTTMFALAALAA